MSPQKADPALNAAATQTVQREPRPIDLIVIGGGIVGLATAYTYLQRYPADRVVVLEKEAQLAAHQTGRNSGVIHSGIYYRPGSMKATTCRRGIALLEAFCTEHDIAWERCGKIVVALDEAEAVQLDAIQQRALANGVTCRPITAEEIRDFEPHCAGVRGLHVSDTGIVDYVGVCRALAEIIAHRGGRIIMGARVTRIEKQSGVIHVKTEAGETYTARRFVACAGLHADRVARLSGVQPKARIVPFRGEYYELRPEARHLVRHLIYPVPNPAFPFLGVHFTRLVARDQHDPRIECGPNAVLALAREGYTKTAVNLVDLWDTLTYPAFWKICRRYWRIGAGEIYRSVSKRAFVRALQRLVPDITAEDLSPVPAGVRAQALGRDGQLLDDFVIADAEGVVNVINAPSPAATASLAIAEQIVARMSG